MEQSKLIEFGVIGDSIVTRFIGLRFRDKILADFDNVEKFVFDFTGVETVSDAFADECFAKLLHCGKEMSTIIQKTTFQNTNPFIQATIKKAYQKRLLQMADDE